MKSLHKLEDKIEGWLKPVPHLPTTWRKWLATNTWWLILIGAVFSGFGLFLLLSLAIPALLLTAGLDATNYGLYPPIVHSWFWIIATFVSVILLFVTVFIMALAVNQLKEMKKKGWELLFLVFVVESAYSILNFLVNFRFTTMLFDAIGLVIGVAISAYVLFELRPYFKVITAIRSKK